ISGLAPNWKILLLSRFFVGLSIGGTIVGVCTYVMEMLLPEQRMALRAFFNWGVARLMLTVICYLLPEWRIASFGNAIAALPALLIVLFIFPESPTWLHSKVRVFNTQTQLFQVLLVIYDTLNKAFNRRKLHQYAQGAVCICFLTLTLLVSLHYQGVAILVINLIGTVFIEYTWDACYLCAVESMPTTMRASSLGSCSLIARIGALLSPTVS
ncbi:unnamed protein product, partial [Gongylonema pulchrum]|uniref:MFS domain-containing protein n=1 Tax=Gongylonema pulchrum TaxID=637853 RepID=A0A183DTE6_9BILA